MGFETLATVCQRALWAMAAVGSVACDGIRPPVPSPPADLRPSVLLITLDTTRADRLGPYGYLLADTPAYDTLAAQGTTFTRAYASCPLTIPSHSTILTGRYPPSHGVRDNGDFILGQDAVLLSERLQAEGYTTMAFTSAFPTQARWGFDQGFDLYHDPLERLPTQLDWRDERLAEDVVDDALASLQGVEGPAFVWVHLFDAHWPYAPPEPFASQHAGRPYDGEIAYAAHHVQRLLDAWEARPGDDLVVLTADHGEGFGDGGEVTHGFLLHDGTIRVPLIVRGPGVEAGVVVDTPVSHVDIVPTVLDIVGMAPHAGLQGRDLRQGGSGGAYSEALTGQFNLGLAPMFSWTGPEGRTTEGAWAGFYGALGTRVSHDAPVRAGIEAKRAHLGTLRASLDEVIAPEATLDAESLQMLQALGYIGGDPTSEAGDVDPRDVIDVIPLTWAVRQQVGFGRFDLAEKSVATLEERMPGTWGVDLLRAQLLQAQGRGEDAFHRFVDLYQRSPTSTVALQLAGLLESTGDAPGAEGWYREALRLQPASPEAMGGIVRTLLAQGDPAEARALADQYLVAYPDHAELSLVRAELFLDEGRLAEAHAAAEFALRKMAWSPNAWWTAGRVRWRLGEPDTALDAYGEALRIAPLHVPLRVSYARRLLEVGRNAEAMRAVLPLVRLMPEDADLQALQAEAQAALDAERAGRWMAPEPLGDDVF